MRRTWFSGTLDYNEAVAHERCEPLRLFSPTD
jgi:hypothetical protein